MKRFLSALSSLCLAATSLFTTFSGMQMAMPAVAADAPAGTVVYDLKAKGKDNTFDGTNNVANVTAGEEVTIEWYVSNDPGTAGMEYSLSFPKCEYVSGKTGKAYSASPEFNDDDKSDIRYVFATKATEVGRTDRPIASFVVKAPSADGSYEVGFTGIKARTVDLEGAVIPTELHNLVLQVGESGGSTTPTSATTTASSGGNVTTEAPPAGTVVYDLKAKGKDNTFNGTNNVANVTAGEEVTIEWYVSNDPGTAGMEYSLSFPKCEYVSGKTGKAYSANPEFNDDDKSDIRYVFATKATEVGRTDRPIASFTVKAPSADGDYEVGFTGIKARTVDLEGAVIKTVLHNLVLHVGEAGGSTTEGSKTTETSKTTSSDNGQTTVVEDGTVVYDLKVKGKDVTFNGKNNVANVTAGEEITIEWYVSNDPGTAGMEYSLNFPKCEYVSGKTGKAYSANPEFNDNDKDDIRYVFATKAVEVGRTDRPIASFTVKAPSADGDYEVGFNGIKARTVDLEGDVIKTVLHNLILHVGEAQDTTTASTQTTASSDTSKTTTQTESTAAPQPAGKASWTIEKEHCAPGATVKVPVIVSGDEGTSGFVINFKADAALKFTGFEWGKAYNGDPTPNDKDLYMVWADENGNDQKGDGVAFYLVFTAPTEAGTYDVTFDKFDITNTDGQQLTVTTKDGAVIVDGAVTPGGKSNWTIGKETVAPNAEAKVPVTVTGDEGTSGFVVNFNYDPALKFNGFTWADGYTGDAVLNDKELYVVWASDDANDQKADGTILYLNFTAPGDEGTYPVTFDKLEVVNTDGSALTVTTEDGAVIVKDKVTPAGKSNWDIGEKTVAKGAAAQVPVTVTGDEGTSGFVVSFAYDEALTFNGFTWADGYSGEAVLNDKELYVVWANAEGNDEKADGVILYLNFTAPDAAGTYPVTFKSLEVVNLDGQELTVTTDDGEVNVPEDTTTTIVTETTTETKPTETTSETTTETKPTETTSETTTETKPTETTSETTTETKPTETTSETTSETTTETKPTETTSETTSETTTETKPTETTTETTTAPAPIPGKATYDIDDVTGKPGETVDVPVKVLTDGGTASLIMQFQVPEGFEVVGFEWGNAYSNIDNEAVWNGKELVLTWADKDGNDQNAKAGSTIITLKVKIPETAEVGKTYPIDFVDGSVEAVDTDGTPLDVTTEGGSITIIAETTTPTETTTTLSKTTETSTTPSDTSTTLDTTTTPSETSTTPTETTADTGSLPSDTSTTTTDTSSIPTETSTTPTETTTTDTTSTTTETTTKVVVGDDEIVGTTSISTSVSLKYTPPTRVNYWSHDHRTFKESTNLEGLSAALVITEYRIDEKGKYVATNNKTTAEKTAYATRELDITEFTHPDELHNSPFVIWEAQVVEVLGADYREKIPYQFDRDHALLDALKGDKKLQNKFAVPVYYYPEEADKSNPDYQIGDGSPVYVGDYNIYIGVKGDYNLDNIVDVNDSLQVQVFYTDLLAFKNPKLNEDPELDGVDGLVFYLANVLYRESTNPDSPMQDLTDLKSLNVLDTLNIQIYYTEVMAYKDPTWEDVCGYDLIDSFYGDKVE